MHITSSFVDIDLFVNDLKHIAYGPQIVQDRLTDKCPDRYLIFRVRLRSNPTPTRCHAIAGSTARCGCKFRCNRYYRY